MIDYASELALYCQAMLLIVPSCLPRHLEPCGWLVAGACCLLVLLLCRLRCGVWVVVWCAVVGTLLNVHHLSQGLIYILIVAVPVHMHP